MGACCGSTKSEQSRRKKSRSLVQQQLSSDLNLTLPAIGTIPANFSLSKGSHGPASPIIDNSEEDLLSDSERRRKLIKNKMQQPFEFEYPTIADHDLFEDMSTPEKPQNLENFVVIWLDEHIVKDDLIAAVRAEVNFLEIFHDVERCIGRIFNIVNERIFVIVSGEYYHQIAYLLELCEQVEAIYIFCANRDKYELYKEEHKVWKEYKKIVDVFIRIDSICEHIKHICNRYAHQMPVMVSIPRRRLVGTGRQSTIDKLEASFMYSQLIKDILISMKHQENAKKELIHLFRTYYYTNAVKLRQIDEFERVYRSDNAIWWYTKEPFLYEVLNKALRLQNIDILYKMRFFITDLHHRLRNLHSQTNYNKPFKVYRGQSMSQEEFQTYSNNVGGLISFSNLLSCSLDSDIARAFADSQEQRQDMIPILLQITVDPSVRNTSFAKVERDSCNAEEREFLFSMGTIFRIQSIRQLPSNHRVQVFDLLLTNDEDEDLRDLRECMRQEIGGTNNLINFGRLLINMGNLNQSEEFYKIVYRETSLREDPRTMAMIYNDLGCIASHRNWKQQALERYKTALSIGHERFPRYDAQLSPILNNIGEIYFALGYFNQAEEYYNEALEIDLKVIPPNIYYQAIRYHNIGMVHKARENYREALKNFKKSLALKTLTLPPNHPSIAISYRSIGDVCRCQESFLQALEHCHTALNIEKQSLPPDHPSLSDTYHCIGLIYYCQGKFTDALDAITTARDIAKKTLPASHPNIINIENDINMINAKIFNLLRRHIY